MPSRIQTLAKTVGFYGRFLPSFTRIGFIARGLPLQPVRADLTGQTWLVTGASGGIGRATSLAAARCGARVLAVGRNVAALDALVAAGAGLKGRIVPVRADLGLVSENERLVATPQVAGSKIDVLVNNVGILLHDHSTTSEGFETSYATNLLGHYALTEALYAAGRLVKGGTIVNVASGGLYNVPLTTALLAMPAQKFSGIVAYAAHKRAQLTLTDHWRRAFAATDIKTYAMHPGWADTGGVKASMAKFRQKLKMVLRDEHQGADTAVWLGATRPAEAEDRVWFDRKPRSAHAYARTRETRTTSAEVVAFLDHDRARARAAA